MGGYNPLALLDASMGDDPRYGAVITGGAATEESMAMGADDLFDSQTESLQTGLVHPYDGVLRVMDYDDVLDDVHDDVQDGLTIIIQGTVVLHPSSPV